MQTPIPCRVSFLLATVLLLVASCSLLCSAQETNSTALWTVGVWGDCGGCSTTSATQTRTAQCEVDSVVVTNTTLCTETKPGSVQSCSCSSSAVSTLMLSVALIVGVVGGTLVFVFCCYFRKFVQRRIRDFTRQKELTDIQAAHEAEQADLELAERLSARKHKRKKKSHKKKRSHGAGARYETEEHADQDGTEDHPDDAPAAATHVKRVIRVEDNEASREGSRSASPVPHSLAVDVYLSEADHDDKERAISPRSPQPRHQPNSHPSKSRAPKKKQDDHAPPAPSVLLSPIAAGSNEVHGIKDGHLLFSPVMASAKRHIRATSQSTNEDETGHYIFGIASLPTPHANAYIPSDDVAPDAPNEGGDASSTLPSRSPPRSGAFSFDVAPSTSASAVHSAATPGAPHKRPAPKSTIIMPPTSH